MRAWIFSDLHIGLPRSRPPVPAPDADVCICAGAIFIGGPARAVSYLGDTVSHLMPVIFVPGDGDYHGGSVLEGRAEALERASKYPDLHFLDRAEVKLSGFRFIGATLWGDEELSVSPGLSLFIARRDAWDRRKMKMSLCPSRRLSAERVVALGREDRQFLGKALEDNSGAPTVVVTHHAPSMRSIAPGVLSEGTTPEVGLAMEEAIERHQPVAWVHGNLDRRNDYLIATTRVISNPRGYPDRPVRRFDPGLVIDLPQTHPRPNAPRRPSAPSATAYKVERSPGDRVRERRLSLMTCDSMSRDGAR